MMSAATSFPSISSIQHFSAIDRILFSSSKVRGFTAGVEALFNASKASWSSSFSSRSIFIPFPCSLSGAVA